ncbi:hypothetical protein [Thermoanaerobacterium thermosaccharolyticum]|uniref:hypothetical protein n=1 Tax=Thermoanaerobacterium thermosaccharolyticum TaxID=1517 RepID=UPI003DA8A251
MDEINEEIVAVIEAAIFAAYGEVSKFRIKTIKRVNTSIPEWRKAGLYSQMK